MATQSLEQYLSEATKSYENSRNAIQSQIDNISTDLAAQKERINAQYAQQSKTLNDNMNYQAQANSMASSNNGGSFGGANQIANKKYAQQTYVPALTQLQTNQANDLSSAESTANSNRLSLSSQLASLYDTATQTAQSRYYDALEAEKDREASLKAAQISADATANAYKYLNSSSTSSNWGSVVTNKDASGNSIGANFYDNDGNAVKLGTYATNNNKGWQYVAQNTLSTDEYNQLMRIVNAQKGTSRSTVKTGSFDSAYMKKITGGNTSDYNLMKRLGLSF